MKKILASITVLASLAGCNGALNHNTCRNSVVNDVGTQSVVEVEPWKFVAKDKSGNVWYYETMSQSGPQVTKKTPVFFVQN